MTTTMMPIIGTSATDSPLPRQVASRDAERLRRYREYLDYAEGRRGAAPHRPRERSLTFNYARAIVEKGASYLVTAHRPVVTASGSGVPASTGARRAAAAAERLLLETWDANELARLDIETEIDTATLGDGAYKITWDDREERVIVSAPDVQGLFVWWHGDDVRRVQRVASRYTLDADAFAERAGHTAPAFPSLARDTRAGTSLARDTRAGSGQRPATVDVVESWTASRFELWAQDDLIEARENPYGVIPFVIYPNLPQPKQFWGVSDIEPIRESLEELNRAISQLSRILELSGNPIAVLENVEEGRDIAVQPGAVWELPEQARAYLLDLLQGGGVRLHVEYVDLIYRTLSDLAEIPRVAFGDGRGDRSGISLQMELDPLLRRVERKRLIRTAAMRRRDALALRIAAQHTGRRFEGIHTDIEWEPSLPPAPLATNSPPA